MAIVSSARHFQREGSGVEPNWREVDFSRLEPDKRRAETRRQKWRCGQQSIDTPVRRDDNCARA
jgi:hypothetical protein